MLPAPPCAESVELCCPTLPLKTGVDVSPAPTGDVTTIQNMHIKTKSQLERVVIFTLHTWSFPFDFKSNNRKKVFDFITKYFLVIVLFYLII